MMRACASAVAALGLLGAIACTTMHAPTALTVFAASSLTTALERATTASAGTPGRPVRFSFAATATLARQIDAGANADLIVTADERWMTFLQDRGRLAAGTRTALLGNRLVVVVPAGRQAPPAIDLAAPQALVALIGTGRLAIGDPDHVPAGTYAKEALTALGVWPALERSLAKAENVRAAMTLVERGESAAGIVYESDAALSTKVAVAAIFPEPTHRPITYEVAIVAGRDAPTARAYLAALRSDAARRVFTAAHFTVK